MIPVLGRDVEACQQRLAILEQAGHGLVVLGAVLPGEGRDRRLGIGPGLGPPEVARGGLDRRAHGFRDLVQHIGCLVHPAPLLSRARCCRVRGKASSSAFQNPSAPALTAISGAMARPRAFRSTKNSRQL